MGGMMMADSGAVGNMAKMVGEAILPGTSNFADGNIKAGTGHLVVAVVLGAALGAALGASVGALAVLLTKANSFSYSVSEKHLHQHAGELFSSATGGGSTAG